MISKERKPEEHLDADRFSKAGAKAEKQMAFYLRRAFVDSDEFRVFNDLRLTDDTGEAAQMDHLILHRYGFIVVESKSVSSKLRVNEQKEFSRFWNQRWEGMPSPIQQAKVQMDLLRRMLNQNAENLLSKMLGLVQARFGNCPMEVIVAISDHGQIDRPRKVEIPELVKADQVVDRVRAIYESQRKVDNILAIATMKQDDGLYRFNDHELDRLTYFLIRRHTPRHLPPEAPDLSASIPDTFQEESTAYGASVDPIPVPEPIQTVSLGQCDQCGTQSMIKWGRYGYYWKCGQCDNNMPIKEYCPTCNKKMKLRKDGMNFYKRCERCQTEEHYCVFEEAD